MSIGIEFESSFKRVERAIQRLWENINAVDYACRVAEEGIALSQAHHLFQFKNIRSNSPKNITRDEGNNSLKDIRESHAWRWCLIVAVSQFDAWLEDSVNRIHKAFPMLRGEACLRSYRFNTPSFSDDFFIKDQSAIGLNFPRGAPLIAEFVKWKEARNCLVHKGGLVAKRYAERCTPTAKIGTTVKLNSDQAREALSIILQLAKEIRTQLRRQLKLHSKRFKPS